MLRNNCYLLSFKKTRQNKKQTEVRKSTKVSVLVYQKDNSVSKELDMKYRSVVCSLKKKGSIKVSIIYFYCALFPIKLQFCHIIFKNGINLCVFTTL